MAGQIERARGKAAYRRAISVGGLKNTVAPAITGDAEVGQTLSVTNGTWTGPNRTYVRQWRRNGHPIAGEGGTTYELTEDDRGAVIDVLVTATANANIIGAAAQLFAVSNKTDAVIGEPLFSEQPSITGTAQEGETLTGNPGAHDGETETYRWLADDEEIEGETTASLELTSDQVGTVITFEVTASNDAGDTVATSEPTEEVIAAE